MEPMIGQKFAYAYGRTGVLQLLLLKQSDVDRLLGARDRNETEKILTELKLTTQIDQGISKGDAILQALRSWIRREVEQMSAPAKRPVFSILWSQGDEALLCYLLKEKRGLTSAVSTEPETSLTAHDPEELRAFVAEGIEGQLPSHFVKFVRELQEKPDLTPQEIDHAVTQFFALLRLRLARSSGSRLIKQYVQHTIDLQNIRTALRAYEEEERSAALLEGGEIAPDKLRGNRESVLAAVNRSSLPYELSESIERAGDDPIALERTCADVLAGDITRMWNVPLSIEPLFAFAAIALSNITLIRTVLIGKDSGFSPQEIKKMLPPFIAATHYQST